MADYKRMVSYMYQYDNGAKKKNVGYARVEAKNGECKITLHMQLLGLLDSIFPIYMIQRRKGDMELVYVGEAVLKNQIIDSRLSTKEASIMNSGYSLSDMGGILLFLNNSVFYATEWDDKPVILSEVLDALRPKGKESSNNPLPPPGEEEIDRDSTEKPDTLEVLQTEDKKDPSVPFYKLPRGWKTIELQHPEDEKEPVNPWGIVARWRSLMGEQRENAFSEPAERQPEEQREEQLQNRPDDEKPEQRPLLNVEPRGDLDGGQEALAKPETPLAAKIYESYPRIYPFEDNEITMCVKIEPKDIGYLPAEAWVLSNNSFLLHGYYCYNHLILAKIKERSGFRYILGVPGIYHNRERFMARMFGFDCFKSVRRRELRQGDFGYWYVPVSL